MSLLISDYRWWPLERCQNAQSCSETALTEISLLRNQVKAVVFTHSDTEFGGSEKTDVLDGNQQELGSDSHGLTTCTVGKHLTAIIKLGRQHVGHKAYLRGYRNLAGQKYLVAILDA